MPGARYTAGVSDDLWALGLVLYALLTARRPFDGRDDASFIEAVLTSEPLPPHEENARVPRALSDVCLRLLEKWPEVRTSSAQATASALEAALRSADATWDVPLCDTFAEDTATTEGGRDSEERWLHLPLHRPRRGKRAPPVKKPEPPEDAASAAEAPPPGTTVRVSPRRHLSFGAWAVVALALALVAAGVVLMFWTSRVAGSVPTRQEVAPSDKSPQADRAAAPTGPEATAAVVALPATLQEVSATVTTQPTQPPSLQLPSKPAKKGMRVMARAVSTAVACTALACPGPQVRPAPPPEPCPVNSEKVMKKLGVWVGARHPVSFVAAGRGSSRVVPIVEGPVEVGLVTAWFDIPEGTMLSGYAIVRDRVYVRLNWATTPEGDTFPVCLNLETLNAGSGLEREPGEDPPSRARIYSDQLARAVSEFP